MQWEENLSHSKSFTKFFSRHRFLFWMFYSFEKVWKVNFKENFEDHQKNLFIENILYNQLVQTARLWRPKFGDKKNRKISSQYTTLSKKYREFWNNFEFFHRPLCQRFMQKKFIGVWVNFEIHILLWTTKNHFSRWVLNQEIWVFPNNLKKRSFENIFYQK